MIRSLALPLVWGLNCVWLAAPIGFGEAISLAERHLADLPYRHLVVDDAPGAERLADEFASAGWQVEIELTMVLSAARDLTVDTSRVIETGEADALAVYRRWIGEALEEPEQAQLQVVEHARRMWRVRNARRLGVVGDSGRLGAITVLMSDGTIAQVEDVYTVPEQRRRGFARALVSRGIELARGAGCELTFIVADDRDWPKQLYSRLGFDPAFRTWSFHRDQSPAR